MVDYTAHFVPDPLPLLRRAALYLPNNTYDPGYVQPVRAVNPVGTMHAGADYSGMAHRVEPANPIPTVIELADADVANEHTRWSLGPQDGTGLGHAFDAYFLPWDDTGSAAEMTLPNPPAADYFFTSALSGCSVIVTGTLQAPTIYHCGIDSANWGAGNRIAKPANVPLYWREYVNYFESLRPGGARPIIAEINKEHYITEPGVTYAYPTDIPGVIRSTTQYAVDFMNNPLHHYRSRTHAGTVHGGEADPWGVFFGVYDNVAGQWDFYLQENMLAKHAGKRVRTGICKGLRRKLFPVYRRAMLQSLTWRLRSAHVVPPPIGAPVFTANNWAWNEVKDGNLWLP